MSRIWRPHQHTVGYFGDGLSSQSLAPVWYYSQPNKNNQETKHEHKTTQRNQSSHTEQHKTHSKEKKTRTEDRPAYIGLVDLYDIRPGNGRIGPILQQYSCRGPHAEARAKCPSPRLIQPLSPYVDNNRVRDARPVRHPHRHRPSLRR